VLYVTSVEEASRGSSLGLRRGLNTDAGEKISMPDQHELRARMSSNIDPTPLGTNDEASGKE
jgi:hypothetical protein